MSDIPEKEIINDEPSVTEEKNGASFNLRKEVFEWIYTILIALVIAFFIKGFLFDVVKVDGESMFPTLMHNDRLIITKLGYEPEKKDIIILDSAYKNREAYYEALEASGMPANAVSKLLQLDIPENLKRRYYVKRVIALEGQTVDIADGKVLVDGEILEEEYYQGSTPIIDSTVQYPVTVAKDHIFVMGDNRPHSKDSRSSDLGQVPVDAVLGKAQLRIWPLNSIGLTR